MSQSAVVEEAFTLVDSLEAVLLEATIAFERRAEPRIPMFREVKLSTTGGTEQMCFVRDISIGGIGLLHRGQIEQQDVVVRIPLSDREVALRVYVSWSRECGQGWSLSGGRLIGAIEDE